MPRILSISNQDLIQEADFSSLKASVSAGSGTITVYSISKFAINYILQIGEPGQEGSEIIPAHSSTSPSGYTITLASNLVKSHPQDTKVYIIPFNQVEFSNSATEDGSKSVLDTIAIDPEKTETTYSTTTDSGYFFSRWYNSITNSYGDYSDPLLYTGYPSNTVGYAIKRALSETNKKISEILTKQMLIDEVNSCLRYIRGKLKKWSNVQEFNYVLDATLVEDDYTWALPDSYYDKNSNRSLLSIRIGDGDPLVYVDKKEFDDYDGDSSNSGQPHWFTTYDGNVLITPKVGVEYVGDSIYMDFYTDIVEVNSDSDTITLIRHDMIKSWLKWYIRTVTERNGKPDYDDGDWVMFQSILADAIRRESSGQKFKLSPRINRITYNTVNE